MHVRWMIRRDMPDVLALEAGTVGEWSESDYIKSLCQRNCIAMVTENEDGAVVGVVCYELHKRHLEVLRLVGESTDILKKLINKLWHNRRVRIHARLHPDDIETMAKYSGAGFRQIGRCEWRYLLLAPVEYAEAN